MIRRKNSTLCANNQASEGRASCSGELPWLPNLSLLAIVILDLRDGGERYFDDFPIRAFHLYAGCCERLSGFHAANDSPHPLSIHHHDFDVVLAVERLQGSECFGNFQLLFPPTFSRCRA